MPSVTNCDCSITGAGIVEVRASLGIEVIPSLSRGIVMHGLEQRMNRERWWWCWRRGSRD